MVLCDRFSDSTFAYQGFARGLDLEWLQAANEVATGGLTPDLTLVIDLPVSVGLARRRADRGEQNRLDRETERFHRKVRRGFLALAAEEPGRMTIVNANRPAQEVQDELTEIVVGWIARQRHRPRRTANMPFHDCIGHQQSIAFLQSAVTHERLAHAYLFHGEEAIGKRLTAIALPKLSTANGLRKRTVSTVAAHADPVNRLRPAHTRTSCVSSRTRNRPLSK